MRPDSKTTASETRMNENGAFEDSNLDSEKPLSQCHSVRQNAYKSHVDLSGIETGPPR
jgi:hypothetical protein